MDGAQARLKRLPGLCSTLFHMVERVDGAQARLKQEHCKMGVTLTVQVERVDGAQARLKRSVVYRYSARRRGGKGGWGSGEIETYAQHA